MCARMSRPFASSSWPLASFPSVASPDSGGGAAGAEGGAAGGVAHGAGALDVQRWDFMFEELIGERDDQAAGEQGVQRARAAVMACPALNWVHKAILAALMGWCASANPAVGQVRRGVDPSSRHRICIEWFGGCELQVFINTSCNFAAMPASHVVSALPNVGDVLLEAVVYNLALRKAHSPLQRSITARPIVTLILKTHLERVPPPYSILTLTFVSFRTSAFPPGCPGCPQVGAIVALQVAMLAYLVVVRPYAERSIHLVELAAHGLELCIFACALAMHLEGGVSVLDSLAVAAFILTLAALVGHEVFQMVRCCVTLCRRKTAPQSN